MALHLTGRKAGRIRDRPGRGAEPGRRRRFRAAGRRGRGRARPEGPPRVGPTVAGLADRCGLEKLGGPPRDPGPRGDRRRPRRGGGPALVRPLEGGDLARKYEAAAEREMHRAIREMKAIEAEAADRPDSAAFPDPSLGSFSPPPSQRPYPAAPIPSHPRFEGAADVPPGPEMLGTGRICPLLSRSGRIWADRTVSLPGVRRGPRAGTGAGDRLPPQNGRPRGPRRRRAGGQGLEDREGPLLLEEADAAVGEANWPPPGCRDQNWSAWAGCEFGPSSSPVWATTRASPPSGERPFSAWSSVIGTAACVTAPVQVARARFWLFSPTARVWLVPSVISAIRTDRLRKKSPSPLSRPGGSSVGL